MARVGERNTFRRLKMNAITLGAEYGFWREAGWVEGVVVRDNVIEDVCRDAALHGGRAYVLGAISIFGRGSPRAKLPVWPGNRNIVIENNVIRDCPAAGIFAATAKDVQIRGNRLEHVLYDPGENSGRDIGLSVREAIDARYAEHVSVTGNTLVKIGVEPVGR